MLCTSIWKGKAREERCLFTHTHFYCLLTSKVTLLPLKRVTRVIRASFMTAFLKDKTPKSRDIAMNEWQIFSTMTEIIFDIHTCTFCRVKRGFYFVAQEIITVCCHVTKSGPFMIDLGFSCFSYPKIRHHSSFHRTRVSCTQSKYIINRATFDQSQTIAIHEKKNEASSN